MNEKMRNLLLKDCLTHYYEEDKKILLDSSVVQITCSPFLVYNLIFFGNKIIILKETLDELKKLSKKKSKRTRYIIMANNSAHLLEKINDDERNNYQIITMPGENPYIKTKNILQKNKDCIFYLANEELFNKLIEDGIDSKQLYLLREGEREVDPFKDKIIKFETIGAIRFENQKMLIYPKDEVVIKVFNHKGIEKTDDVKEVKPRDFILIKKIKNNNRMVCSIKLYKVVSKHTRNHAVRIIWTDLKSNQRTNKYIGYLPNEYQKLILENI